MSTNLENFKENSWEAPISSDEQNRAVHALENGKVLFLPSLEFSLKPEEREFLSASILDPKVKNISYDGGKNELKGSSFEGLKADRLKEMIGRYSLSATSLLKNLLPFYNAGLIPGKTSFRPVEVEGRKSSCRKDDTLLHVDSFPSNPTQGHRILRVFTNVNPEGKPRVWRVGEPLQNVFHRFVSKVDAPIWGVPTLLKVLGITKAYRTSYDHYMLQIHDKMKEDRCYQQNVTYEEILFPPGSSWIVFTDQVSHAAMSGQHLFEQTFYLPVEAQQDPKTSPLRLLEEMLNKKLIDA